ncbi:MAG TPA: rod shape-determining protein MreD [Candidatus Portnoybacteria bacterium]|nr:rod shape-determining protein MreD [Candidatus Portnoybacteria bacterium]
MKIVFIFLISILSVAAQLTLMPHLSFLAATPNLILASVLAWAIWRPEDKKEWFILIPILLFDLVAGQPFGLITLSLCLVFFCLEELGLIIFKQNDLPAVFSLTFLGIVLFELFQVLLSRLFAVWHLMEPIRLTAFYFYGSLPFNLLLNGALSLLFLWALNKSKIFQNNGPLAKLK